MIPKTFDEAFTHTKTLVTRFAANESVYLAQSYIEQEARDQFLNPFFEALGWDVYHKEHPNPYEREVKIEKSVMVGDRGKRADYAFFTKPNFLQARFMAEAKKPARQLKNQDDCFQAMRYGWNSNTPIAVLTDFEQFLVLDSRYKPNVLTALNGVLEEFHYKQFADEEQFRKLYYLFSREAVGMGSLEKFAATLKKSKKASILPRAETIKVQPVGDTFLTELDEQRELLARSFKRANASLDGEQLTEITQRTLDRLVFIRFLEDKLVEPSDIVDRLGQKSGSAWRDFANEMPRLNTIYNGIIFKPHDILDSRAFSPDDKTFGDTLKWISHKNSAYDFNSIPIHILGSIYERFLGKTITVTDKRAKVEEKPEVRKAGGVYYTPEYIVRYIVENTIGKLLSEPPAVAGGSARRGPATPEEIAKMRFADIACGSGSFVLGMFDYLIKYHADWYASNKTRRADAIKQGLCRESADGNLQLSLDHKRDILINNIYGVDLDAQAVEVAQLSLYLKLLEEETTATAKQFLTGFKEQLLPNLNKNIVHGNSLIDYDIMDGQLFDASELKKLNPMNFANTFPEVFANDGFDAIVGNPPYIRIQTMQETSPVSVEHLKKKYISARKGNYDIYVVFVEKGLSLLNEKGKLGFILPHKFFNAKYGESLRGIISKGNHLSQVVHFADQQIFVGATTYTCLLFLSKQGVSEFEFIRVENLGPWRDGGACAVGTIPAEKVNSEDWNFSAGKVAVVINRLRQIPIKLGDVTSKIFQGLITGADSVFILHDRDDTYFSEATGEIHDLERELMHPLCKGSVNLRRYEVSELTKSILFPYKLINGRAELIRPEVLKRDFPFSWKYLEQNRSALESRERGKWKHDRWYAFGRSQNLAEMDQKKILTPSIANRSSFSLDSQDYFYFVGSGGGGGGGYGILLRDEINFSYQYLLGLLNSKLLDTYLKSLSSPFSGGYFAYNRQYIEQLPIRTIDFDKPAEKAMHDKVVELVEKMIAAKKDLASARTDSDKQFYERYCDTLDRQIDDLVYQLYDITPDERKIIEGT